MGGKAKNMHAHKRTELTGRGGVDKTAVVGTKDRETNQVHAKVVVSTDKPALHGFVYEHATAGATVYTDEARVYKAHSRHGIYFLSAGAKLLYNTGLWGAQDCTPRLSTLAQTTQIESPLG